jgi:aminoglycoside 6-adenylyltransferase
MEGPHPPTSGYPWVLRERKPIGDTTRSNMRNEQEMLKMIVNTAKDDDRIRAAMINGSRVNPHGQHDIFQDFDITYFVTDIDSFTDDHTWIERFGEIMILQMPEAMEDPPPMNDGHFAYLMQFIDGNRIDLTLFPLARLPAFQRESLSLLLLDKDGLFEPLPSPSDSGYLPKPPTAKAFSDCCNEFWWVCSYAAKGLWREEIIYAKYMLDNAVREQLMKMLTWHVGVKTQFAYGPGKFGKHLKQYLEPTHWTMLEKTYSDASYDKTWGALHTMCNLFRITATGVAEYFRFDYPHTDDEKVSAHLKHVQSLPRNATEIY